MTLYTAETVNITVTAGVITNGTGLPITTSPASPTNLAWTYVSVSADTLSSPCLFTCTVTTLGNAGTLTANVSVTETYGNTVSNLGAGHSVTVATPTSGAGSGGSFTAPAPGTSFNLNISPTGPADSTLQFTFQAQPGTWTSDTITAQTLGGTTYTNTTATLKKLNLGGLPPFRGLIFA